MVRILQIFSHYENKEFTLKKYALSILIIINSLNPLFAQVGDLIWEENFNNLENWTAAIGNGSWGWGNGEVEFYHGDNVEISEIPGEAGNMALHLTARLESGPGIIDQWGNPLNYTSGKVTTKAKVAVQYGMIEARVNVPDLDLGGWPAVWLLGEANYAWPYCGELDMMEMGSRQEFRDLHDTHNGGNGMDNSTVNQSVGANAIFYSDEAVTPENPSGAASISWDPDDDYVRLYYNYDNPLIDRFLIYRMYWDENSIRFTVTDEGVEHDLYTEPFPIDSVSYEFRKPFYLIANLAIGGAFTDAYNLGDPGSGAPVSMPFPADMYLDYIRVYEWNGQGEVRLGPPYPESGSFGIYTDETETNGGLVAGVSSEIYVWANTLVDGSIEPYEGENGISWQTTGSGWFGAGIMASQPLNMSNFGEGHLNFMIKIPSDVTFKIGLIDTWNNQNYLEFPGGVTTHGLVRDGEWGQASIPISEIRGEAIDLRMLSYAFVILEENGANCEFGLDDIYWSGGGIPNVPFANAGPDQIVEDIDEDGSELVTLDGSDSFDPDGTIDLFSWTSDGTEIATGENPTVELSLGEYLITLTVTDDSGNSSSDQVQITVLDNYLPSANAGSDQTLIDANGDGVEMVTLDGSASTDSDGSIVSYSWSEDGIEIATGEIATVELGLGPHQISLDVTDNDGGIGTDALTVRVNQNLPVPAPAIYYANGNITIDDNIEALWLNTPHMEINNVTVGLRTPDFYAQWKAMFDETNLYVLVEVNDNTLLNDSGAEWYKDDCVEMFIDGDNSSGSSYDGINDFQYGFRWDDDEIQLGNNSVSNTNGINHLLYATEVGYNLEVSIPWSTIGVTPSAGSVIGFDVAIDDDDNGGDRECAIASIFTTDNAWHDPSVFGNVPLVSPVSVFEEEATSQPLKYSLGQNFPNPFNPTTTLQYSLPKAGNLKIILFNTLGKEVSLLLDEHHSIGNHSIVIDGENLSSGVYFVVMNSGSFQTKRKIVLLK